MKAQVSVEFLLNFLLMLALVSTLLLSLSHLLSASTLHSEKILEKAKIEEFARTLDAGEAMQKEKFAAFGNYSIGDIDNQGVIVREIGGEQILGYTIYGMGGNDGEPV